MFSIRSFPVVAFGFAVIIFTIVHVSAANVARASIMPAFLKKKTYTPLLYFKVPLGTMDECEYFYFDKLHNSKFYSHLIVYYFLTILYPLEYYLLLHILCKAIKWKK